MAPQTRVRPLSMVSLLLLVLALVGDGQAQSLAELQKMDRPPEMLREPPQQAFYKIGEDLKLECRASSEPAPAYYWEYNSKFFDINGQDNRVTQQPNEGTIVFNNPLKKDEGDYQCIAWNKHGNATSQKVILKAAQLDEFPTKEAADVYSVNVGGSIRLRCIAPKSIPSDPEITWEKYYPYTGDIQPVILSNRVSKDSYGDLYIVSAKKEDQLLNSGEYRCSLFNVIQRKSVAGMRYIVHVTGDKPLSSPPSMMWSTQNNRPIGVRGEKLVLKCIFAGEPIPLVLWDRTSGGEMGKEPRVTTDSFGQELVFNRVEYSDAGNYECGGSNTEAANAQQKPFDLRVESKPVWIRRPENRETGVGETVTFLCQADGIPKPSIKWYINGKSIADAKPNPRRYSTGDNITYVDVTKLDAQVVQCNASNENGYIFANAYLNVIRSKPLWKVPPPPSVTFAEGQTKNLTCQTYAGPRAEVTWIKDGVYLTGGRHIIHRDGNLEIQNIVTTDAGTYNCTAKNKLGQLKDTSEVRVAQPTLIVNKPDDLIVNKGDEAKFTCTAVTDPSYMDRLEIVWKKFSSEIIEGQSERVNQNLRDNSLTITDVAEIDAALYTCEARTNLDSASARAFLRVRNVPNAPEISKVLCKSSKVTGNKIEYHAEIYFTPRGSNYAPINKFTIEYSTDFAPDAWSIIHTTDNANPTLVKLSPYGNYTFRVLAWNFIGKSEPSPSFKTVCRTEPDVPTVQPQNVKAEGSEPNNMVISWTPIFPIEHNGAGFKYELVWNCTEQDCQNNPDTHGQKTIVNYNVDRYVVEKQPSYHRYEVKVTCRNEKGISSAPVVPIMGYSGEYMPTKAPENFEVMANSVASSSATLKWTPVPNNDANIGGFLVGYVIKFRRPDEGLDRDRYELIQLYDPEKRFTIPSTHSAHSRRKRSITTVDLGLVDEADRLETRTNKRYKRETEIVTQTQDEIVVKIGKLPPNSAVQLSVAVFNTRFYGPFSQPVVIRTKEGPPGPVDYFAVKRRNANMVVVEWIKPLDTNGQIVGYDFAQREIIGLNLGDRTWETPVNDPLVRQHNISGLKPEQKYRVYIYAKTAAGRGEENFLDVSTTSAGAPQPPQFDVNNISDHTMNVTWVPSSKGNPGSVFYVQYRKSGRTEWEVSAVETENLHVEILSLSAGTDYEIRVVAQNGYTAEAATGSKWFSTSGSTNSLHFVVGQPWFILLFLIVLALTVLFAVLVLCKDKLKREYPPTQEEEELNQEFDTGTRFNQPSGVNVAFSKSGESLHKPPPDRQGAYREPADYPTDYPQPQRDYYAPERRSAEYYPEKDGRYEREAPYGEERTQHPPAYAPRDEPAPVMHMPPSVERFAPSRHSTSYDDQSREHSLNTSTDV